MYSSYFLRTLNSKLKINMFSAVMSKDKFQSNELKCFIFFNFVQR